VQQYAVAVPHIDEHYRPLLTSPSDLKEEERKMTDNFVLAFFRK
jgi:hypothetical protein